MKKSSNGNQYFKNEYAKLIGCMALLQPMWHRASYENEE